MPLFFGSYTECVHDRRKNKVVRILFEKAVNARSQTISMMGDIGAIDHEGFCSHAAQWRVLPGAERRGYSGGKGYCPARNAGTTAVGKGYYPARSAGATAGGMVRISVATPLWGVAARQRLP